MKFKIRVLFVILCVCISFCPKATKAAETISKNHGKLKIAVDPNQELLSTIELLYDWPITNQSTNYSIANKSYFSKYAEDSCATDLIDYIVNLRLSRDGLVAFMLSLSNTPELKISKDIHPMVLRQVKNDTSSLVNLAEKFSKFAKKTDFESFWISNKSFYNSIIDLTASNIPENTKFITQIESYYSDSANSYNLVVCPINLGGYGISITSQNKNKEFNVCLQPMLSTDGIPYVNYFQLYDIFMHELSHSFINPLVEQNREHVMATQELFPINSKYMDGVSSSAYVKWETYVYEYCVRAATIRLIANIIGEKEAKNKISEEVNTGFIFIEPIVDEFINFERQNKKDKIKLAEYFPKIIGVFDSLKAGKYQKFLKPIKFNGPINSTLKDSTLIIYPTNDANRKWLTQIQNYVKSFHDVMKSSFNLILVSDSTALTMDLSKYNMLAYGTVESNLILNKYKQNFPFKFTDNELIADKKYDRKNIKLISCLPNPNNPEKGLIIYTAGTNSLIYDINGILVQDEDFIICDTNNHPLCSGNYDKDSDWKFPAQDRLNFNGPISSIFNDKIYMIYPTSDKNSENLKIVQDYAFDIYSRLKSKYDIILLSDSTALNNDLSQRSLFILGGKESNLILTGLRNYLTMPFSFENNKLKAGKIYQESELKIMLCLRSPYAKEHGLLILTAESNQYFKNNLTPKFGEYDYIIYKGADDVIDKGFFNKGFQWEFPTEEAK
jgi:DNA-dependent RNA polymerase auxiliary subunit epsilon